MNVCTYCKPASAAASISDLFARARPHTWALSPAFDIILIASFSPLDMTGNPASIASTPRSSIFCAMSSFCCGDSETPGVCSPSLNVVSNIRTFKSDHQYRATVQIFPSGQSVVFQTVLPNLQRRLSDLELQLFLQ